jgi:protein transport protein HofC
MAVSSDLEDSPGEKRPDVTMSVVAPEEKGLRVQHLMYAIGVCALIAWLVTVLEIWALSGSVILLIGMGIGVGVVLARRRATDQESFLWALAIAAERSLPLAPAALAFSDQYGRSYRWRVRLFTTLLHEGCPLPQALEQVPGLMTREAQVLVRTGWATGTLPHALRQAAAARAMRQAAWGSLASRLAYIGALLLALQIIVGFVMYFILPKFEAIFKDFGVPLPKATIFTIEMTHFIIKYGFATVPVISALEMFLLVLLPFGMFNVFQWDIPIVDVLFRRRHATLLLRALAMTVEGGKPIAAGIAMLAGGYPSTWVRRRLRDVDEDVMHGRDWIESLEYHRLILPTDAAVISSAQRVGNLRWALEEMAESNERRLGYRLQLCVQLLFPVLVLAMGALVGLFVISYFCPLVVLIERLAG